MWVKHSVISADTEKEDTTLSSVECLPHPLGRQAARSLECGIPREERPRLVCGSSVYGKAGNSSGRKRDVQRHPVTEREAHEEWSRWSVQLQAEFMEDEADGREREQPGSPFSAPPRSWGFLLKPKGRR